MSPARRCALSLVVVAAVLLALHGVARDAVARRQAMLLVLLPLGYAHQLGAWLTGRGRARGEVRDRRCDPARRRRRCWRRIRASAPRHLAGWACLVAGAVLLQALAPRCWPLLALGLALVGAWHVLENELAMARTVGSARLPPVSRDPSAWGLALAASIACVGLAASLPGWTHPLLRLGVPPRFACWTVEEGIAALLLYHVVSFCIFTWERAAVLERVARRRRRRALVVLHTAPPAVAGLLGLAAPDAMGVLAAPEAYLVASVAHALHTARQRRG